METTVNEKGAGRCRTTGTRSPSTTSTTTGDGTAQHADLELGRYGGPQSASA